MTWRLGRPEMEPFDPQVIDRLREMAAKRSPVADMVRAVRPGRDSTSRNAVEVLRYFRAAFDLTLAHVKPIADWVAYGEDESDEEELHRLVWPCIEAGRGSWERKEVAPSES